ncbi:3-methyl-2-oxobutanoate hydroxymethyltransferase [Anaerotalea alkaliphila]|uniref:3-methyl-2-oxobutanoate hydroxymethyltransferase n=1 Tax=Anaerotalea alkaliphila TaxID=2662126 RepID=A0A7X5KMX9_9FIRM|nr:3-methyl-2-oxobutanoate hydroxymethyltransferase [Anaerotalea alkaliphila]NDL66227.1 3-methyl-2-oxobutanoate hydroxymethyltransferase [Anaerotalea alkaliphila]
MDRKKTIRSLQEKKGNKEKITMLTAYDYTMASILDQAGVDAILVGDSLGMVVQGKDTTLEVSMDQMAYHCRCVAAGARSALLVGDLPFLSYHISLEEGIRNAGRLVQEGGVHCVKLEGGREMVPMVEAILRAQIPVMGHIGLTPQSVNALGGFKVQGREAERAKALVEDALALEAAGVFALVLEAVPASLAREITGKLEIPVIGIGAGKDCDGQVLVVHDMLGLYADHTPKFVKRYAELGEAARNAVQSYVREVSSGAFPEERHSFKG